MITTTTSSINDGYHQRQYTQPQPQPVIVEPDSLFINNSYSTSSSVADTVPDLITENNYSSSSSSNNSTSNVATATTTITATATAAEETTTTTVFLPTTYATLLPPTTKLEEEPNPFEQSFEKIKLPSVLKRTGNWDSSLRSGILSPSMLSGPPPPPLLTQTLVRKPIKYELETTFYNHTYENPPPTVNRSQVKNITTSSYTTIEEKTKPNNKRQKKNTTIANQPEPEDEEKRRNFLERNRIAALKCRQRKKQWLQNLQTKVEYLAADNEQSHLQANVLRQELIHLKTLLMAHKDCHINQQEIKMALSRPIPDLVTPSPHLIDDVKHKAAED